MLLKRSGGCLPCLISALVILYIRNSNTSNHDPFQYNKSFILSVLASTSGAILRSDSRRRENVRKLALTCGTNRN